MALLAIFIVLLGLAVLVAQTWRELWGSEKPLKKFWQMRSRYGAYLVHAGILLIVLGIVGVEGLSDNIQGTMAPGDKMPLAEYHFEFVGLTEAYDNPEYLSVRAEIDLWRGDELIARLTPGQDIYDNRGQYVSIPGKRSTFGGDIYTLLLDYEADMGYVVVQATINPLVNFMWLGGLFLCLGAAFNLSSPIVREQALPKQKDDDNEDDSEPEGNAS